MSIGNMDAMRGSPAGACLFVFVIYDLRYPQAIDRCRCWKIS